MPLLSNLLALLALLLLSMQGFQTLPAHLGPQKLSGSGRGLKDQAAEVSTSVLALDEPCGVYTLNCARGLRCMPPPRESSPLQALLQGRGICSKNHSARAPQKPPNTGKPPRAHRSTRGSTGGMLKSSTPSSPQLGEMKVTQGYALFKLWNGVLRAVSDRL